MHATTEDRHLPHSTHSAEPWRSTAAGVNPLARGATLGMFTFAVLSFIAAAAFGAEIRVSATDPDQVTIEKIESAGPGDTVLIGPGVYRFRVYLTRRGSPEQPIVIRAQDSANRPVWDLAGKATADWTGSYGGGDRGRGIWQITGAHYEISSIVFRNGSDRGAGDGGGMRLKSSSHVTVRDCLFQFNDNGLQGAGTDTLIEFSEFDRNGLPGSREGSHNLYIHGGDITVRYSYIHDAMRGQNLHIRANRATFEYNWIARAKTYMADMMTCTAPPCDSDQYLLLRGNVLIVGTQDNSRQVFALVNDQRTPQVAFHLRMINNTIIGNGDAAALVHLVNADQRPTHSQSVFLANNAIVNVARLLWVDRPDLQNWSASGTNNWLTVGTAGIERLSNSAIGPEPGVRSLAAYDLAPIAPSGLIGGAAGDLPDLPDREIYFDKQTTLHWRPRATVRDIGAFESTTNSEAIGFRQTPGHTQR
jgi:hypothetical protein